MQSIHKKVLNLQLSYKIFNFIIYNEKGNRMLSILKNHTILYAEDNLLVQKNIREYLESYFSLVYVASNGNEALALYKDYHPDVLLLDINLPYLSGLELAKEIRKKDKTIKILMLTAYSKKEQLLLATELKLTKYLIKPITPKIFKETMKVLSEELQSNSSSFVNLSKTCVWDKKLEQLRVDDRIISLSEKEHRLLKFLFLNKGKAVSYEDIMVEVWEDSFEKNISIDSVKNQVSHLRKKLPRSCIDSVYGKGYMFR